MFKFTIILSLLFSLSSSLWASRWTVKEKSPYELKVLVESFNMEFLTDEEKEKLKSRLETLDSLMGSLEQSDRFFIAKTTVYKWILKATPFTKPPKEFSLDQFQTKSDLKDLSPFAKWLLMAIKSDVAELISTESYQQYRREIQNRGRVIQNKSIEARVNLIRPWAYLFSKEQGSLISLRLVKYQFILLDNLISQYQLFHRFKNKELPSTTKKLSFFVLDDGTKPITNGQQDKTIKILDEVIEKHKKANLPVPVSDWQVSKNDEWTPKDDGSLSNEAKINLDNPSPDPSYQAPTNLPQPVNDWGIE
jgi:hypothetical protein